MEFNLEASSGKTSIIMPSPEEIFVNSMSIDISKNILPTIDQFQEDADTVFDSAVSKLESLGLSPEEISVLVG